MPYHLDPNATVDFVYPADRGKERPAQFHLRMPRQRDRQRIEHDLVRMRDMKPDQQLEVADGIVRDALDGWSDWLDESGGDIPFVKGKDGKPTSETIRRLTIQDRGALMSEVLGLIGIDVEDQD